MLLSRLLLPMALLGCYLASFGQSAKPASTAVSGLTGTYYMGQNFDRKVFTRVDPAINFKWWHKPPGPGLEAEYYSIRWVGRLFVPVTGRYRFSVEVDDGIRLWVGGRRIIDSWGLHNNDRFEGSVDLVANHYYDLRIDYFNAILEGEIKLYWVIPDEKSTNPFVGPPRQLIGAEYLGREPVRLVVKPAKPASLSSTPPPTVARSTTKPVTKPTITVPPARQQTPRTPPPAPTRTVAPPVAESAVAPSAPVFEQLTVGKKVVLQHVFFEQSDYRLLPASYAELDKLVRTLQQQPTLRLEIAGHTDSVGDPRLNMALSENRAKVVTNYLVRHGIGEERLEPKGYGGSLPLTDNGGEAARAQNRRVEFIVK
ncbi:OmpA family protein [Fibrella sp. WM1]|uniref:OmpA family protein n=1 Tax=Fibrella musci TaxID=3242485 RepID=UPI003520F54F